MSSIRHYQFVLRPVLFRCRSKVARAAANNDSLSCLTTFSSLCCAVVLTTLTGDDAVDRDRRNASTSETKKRNRSPGFDMGKIKYPHCSRLSFATRRHIVSGVTEKIIAIS